MILVTVGGQLPFDRLVRAVDEWAGACGRNDVFAQIGDSDYRPQHFESRPFLPPEDFRERFAAASVIVSHAGMGTVIGALEAGKPILILPRRAALREQRNDHQLATAERLRGRPGVSVAMDEDELRSKLGAIDALPAAERIAASAAPELLDALRAFVAAAPARRR